MDDRTTELEIITSNGKNGCKTLMLDVPWSKLQNLNRKKLLIEIKMGTSDIEYAWMLHQSYSNPDPYSEGNSYKN